MSDLFEEILELQWHEDLSESCEDFDGGLQECEVYYCISWHVIPFKLPSINGTFSSSGSISDNIKCKNRRSFEKINALVDVNELSSSGKSTSLKLFVLGLRDKLIGMKRILERVPLIFIVKDNNNRMFVVGNTISQAYASVELTSGQKQEDNSGATISVSSKMIFFEYKGIIPPYRESDFDSDFNFEFF